MKGFSALYRELDSSTSNLAKQVALQNYFWSAAPADAAWRYFSCRGQTPPMVPIKLPKYWHKRLPRCRNGYSPKAMKP